MRVVFMGTPDFAVPCLSALLDAGMTVPAVFTQPDKPVGRKLILTPPPVKVLAQKCAIPVFQPETLRGSEALLKSFEPDFIAVAAYGKLLPESVLSIPKYGCVNVHASLLPKYRGAAPIQWAVIRGEEKTGVTTMLMEKGLDTGDMLLSEETPIGETETAGELFIRLSQIGAPLLVKTLLGIKDHSIVPIRQDGEKATLAPMIRKETGVITPEMTAKEISCLVRGLLPAPGARIMLSELFLKIYSCVPSALSLAPGALCRKKDRLYYGCRGTAVELLEVQLQNSKRMSAADFLRGHEVPEV